MKKILFLILIIPILYGCPPPCPQTSVIEVGPLSESALALCPYKNGETYKFKHSNGHIIDFTATRETIIQYNNYDYGCGPMLRFEENICALKPNYPIFDIEIRISNPDTAFNVLSIYAGNSYFMFTHSNQFGFVADTFEDSLVLDNKTFYNVQKMKNYGYGYNEIQLADSIYYNQESGIIKIKLSNGESYTVSN